MWIWTRGSFINIGSEQRSKSCLSWKLKARLLPLKCCLHQSSQSCCRRAKKEHRLKKTNRTSAPSQDRREEAPHVAAAGAALAGEPIGLSFSNRLDRALLSTSRRGSFIFLPFIWMECISHPPAKPRHPFLTSAWRRQRCGLTAHHEQIFQPRSSCRVTGVNRE